MSQAKPAPRVNSGIPAWLWVCVVFITLAVIVGTVINTVPEDPEAIFAEAFEAVKNGDDSLLEPAIEKLSKYPEFESQRTLFEGIVASKSVRDPKAIELLKQINEPPEQKAVALLYTGQSQQRMGNLNAAIEAFKEASVADPDYSVAGNALITLYDAVGAIELTRTTARNVLEKNPDNIYAQTILAGLEVQSLNFEEAIEIYSAMLATAGQRASASPEVINHYIDCLIRTDNWEKLIEFHESNPGLITDDTVKLRITLEKGAFTEIQNLIGQPTSTINPNSHQMLYARARMELHNGNVDAAYELGTTILEVRPRELDYLELMKDIAESLGKPEVAAASQENINQVNDYRQQFKNLIANGTANVDDGEVRFKLAELCYEFGYYDHANTWFNRAMQIDPEIRNRANERIQELYDSVDLLVPLSSKDDNPKSESTTADDESSTEEVEPNQQDVNNTDAEKNEATFDSEDSSTSQSDDN